LVGGFSTPLKKYDFISWGYYSQTLHQAAEKVCFDTAAINPLRARCDTSPAGSAVMAIIVKTS
jgi:hypothetical protein